MKLLPPPPPPPHPRTWPHRPALLADRARAIHHLLHSALAPRRLLLLWLLTMLCMLGWVFAVMGLEALADSRMTGFAYTPACVALALCSFVPAALGLRSGLKKDRVIRVRLRQWAALDRDPSGDAAFRAAGLTRFWLLMSILPAVAAVVIAGAYVTEVLTGPLGEINGSTLAYAVGLTAPPAFAGAQGLAKALGQRAWHRSLTLGPISPEARPH